MLKSRAASEVRIRRAFVEVAGRSVHYRVAGQGAAVVMLHESPRSSLSMLLGIDTLAGESMVIAPDTPGYGLSQALNQPDPDIEDFAIALAQFLDAIGVQCAVLYGTHTGAAIAAEFAIRYPRRVSKLILDGFPLFTPSETDDILTHYLPPFRPQWDGSHLMELWSRIKDMTTFFPWYRREPEARLEMTSPPIEFQERTALGFIESGDAYRLAYGAAFRYDSMKVLTQLHLPTTIMARDNDLLADHLKRIPVDTSCGVVSCGSNVGEWGSVLSREVRNGRGQTISREAVPHEGINDRRRLIAVGEGFVHLRAAGMSSEANPVVLLHDIPGSAEDFIDTIQTIATSRPVVAIDMPGCGDSDPLADENAIIEDSVAAILLALDKCNVGTFVLYGEGIGAIMAQYLAIKNADAIEHLFSNTASLRKGDANLAGNLIPNLTPDSCGTHLVGAWFLLRDALLDQSRSSNSMVEANAVSVLDRKLRALVKGPTAGTLAEALLFAAPPPVWTPTVEISSIDELSDALD